MKVKCIRRSNYQLCCWSEDALNYAVFKVKMGIKLFGAPCRKMKVKGHTLESSEEANEYKARHSRRYLKAEVG